MAFAMVDTKWDVTEMKAVRHWLAQEIVAHLDLAGL